MKVKELIRELKKFPNDYKVAFESYEEESDIVGEQAYRVHNVRFVEKDDKAEDMLIIK
jgi:hypothetical protein